MKGKANYTFKKVCYKFLSVNDSNHKNKVIIPLIITDIPVVAVTRFGKPPDLDNCPECIESPLIFQLVIKTVN